MRKSFSLLLLHISLVGSAFAQIADTAQIKQFLRQAQSAIYISQYSEALKQAEAALRLLPQKGEDSLRMVTMGMLGEARIELGEYAEGIKFFKEALAISISAFGTEDVRTGSTLNSLGRGYQTAYNYQEALAQYRKAVAIYDRSAEPVEEQFANCYGNMGICFNELKDYKNALLFFEKSLALNKKIYGDDHIKVGSGYNNLGMFYKDQGNPTLAIEYFKKGLNILIREFGEKHKFTAWLYGNIAIGFRNQSKYDSAFVYYQRQLKVYESLPDERPVNVSEVYNNQAICMMYQSKFEESRDYFFKALKIRKEQFGEIHSKTAILYEGLGASYLKQGLYDTAIDYFKKSLLSLGCVSIDHCPYQTASSAASLMTSCGELAKAYALKCRSDTEDRSCELASQYYHLAIQILDHIKSGYDEYESKELLTDEYYYLFDGYINFCLTSSDHEKKGGKKHQAFIISEKSKCLILKEALQAVDAKQFAGIPDSLLKEERRLAMEITELEEEKFSLSEDPGNPEEAEVLAINGKIFDKKRAFHQILETYKQFYPSYYQMKYAFPEVSVKAVQEAVLSDRQTLLEYFVGDEAAFVFAIKRDTFLVKQIQEADSLRSRINAFYRLLSRFPALLMAGDSRSDSLVSLAYKLYQQLVAPVEGELTEELIIVPDGLLDYLPFEALLSKMPEDSRNYQDMAWLLRSYAVSYCSSAALLMEVKENSGSPPAKELLCVAPEFAEDRLPGLLGNAAVGKLEHNLPEAKAIIQLLGGDLLAGSEATADKFSAIASDYKLLHLATHAVANDQSGDYSFLVFADPGDSAQSAELYAKDIYNLQLKAELVVLSACETGIGELRRGEGFISLSRAFTYAGAKSLLTSLWQVNDKKTAELMRLFYVELSKEKKKHLALRDAKLAWLASSSGEAGHPFYWAPFKAQGSMAAIKITKTKRSWWWTILLAGGLLAFFYRQKKKRKKRPET